MSRKTSVSGLSRFFPGSAGLILAGIHTTVLSEWVSNYNLIRLKYPHMDLSIELRCVDSALNRSFESVATTRLTFPFRILLSTDLMTFTSSIASPTARISADPIERTGRSDFGED